MLLHRAGIVLEKHPPTFYAALTSGRATRRYRVDMPTRRTLRNTLGALLLLTLPGSQPACASEPAATTTASITRARALDLPALADLAISTDATIAADARMRLRAAGPAGLAAFLARHTPPTPTTPAKAAPTGLLARVLDLSSGTDDRVTAALDEICAQHDCAAARLYWYTDLEQAKDAARASGKPILSLRLLGDLTDELSCANSRFFRALLYPDPAVSAVLRERFVLHWQSERPAPKITIDYGDGRSVVTTITGNSVHYVLDATGRPVDAIPGLVHPRAFVDDLQRAAVLARVTAGLTGEPLAAALRRHHDERLGALARAWDSELLAVDEGPQPRRPTQLVPRPRAGQAAPIAISKMAIEAPMLGRIGEPAQPVDDAALWDRLAARHESDVTFSAASLAMLEQQQWRSGDRAQDAADHATALATLRRAVALDTLRNEFELHRQIHARLSAAPQTLDDLNAWIYGDLFLTPRSDPWLGLAAPTIVSGLPGGGRRVDARI